MWVHLFGGVATPHLAGFCADILPSGPEVVKALHGYSFISSAISKSILRNSVAASNSFLYVFQSLAVLQAHLHVLYTSSHAYHVL